MYTLANLLTTNTPAQNTAAIVAAFPHVQLPDGNYEVDPIAVVSGVRIRGNSADSCTLKLASRTINNDPAFGGVVNIHGTSTSHVVDVILEDFSVDANSSGMTLTGTTEPLNIEAVSFSYADRCNVYRLHVMNAVSDGFDYDYSIDCVTEDCRATACGGFGFHNSLTSRNLIHSRAVATNCGFVQLRGGFDAHGTSPNEAHRITFIGAKSVSCYRGFLLGGDYNTMIGCRDEGSQENGLRITGDNNKIIGCVFTGTTVGNAVTIDQGDRNVLYGNECSSAAGGGIVMTSGATNNSVSCNQCNSNSGRGIQVNAGASNNAIIGNCCSGNAAGNLLNSGSGNQVTANIV